MSEALLRQIAERHGVQCGEHGPNRELTHMGLTICVAHLVPRQLEQCRGRTDYRALYEDLATFGWEAG